MGNRDVIFLPPKLTDLLHSIHGPWPPAASYFPLLGDSAFLWAQPREWPVDPMTIQSLSQAGIGTTFTS